MNPQATSSAAAPETASAAAADALLEEMVGMLGSIERLARASVTEYRTAELLDADIRRLFGAFARLPLPFDREFSDLARQLMEEQIAAIRAVPFNAARHANNETLRFMDTYEHEQQANATYERLLSRVRRAAPGLRTATAEPVDGSFVLAELASRPRHETAPGAEEDEEAMPRGDYRAAVQMADFNAVFDITSNELNSLAERLAQVKRGEAIGVTQLIPSLPSMPVIGRAPPPLTKIDLDRIFAPGLRRVRFREPFVGVSPIAVAAAARRASKQQKGEQRYQERQSELGAMVRSNEHLSVARQEAQLVMHAVARACATGAKKKSGGGRGRRPRPYNPNSKKAQLVMRAVERAQLPPTRPERAPPPSDSTRKSETTVTSAVNGNEVAMTTTTTPPAEGVGQGIAEQAAGVLATLSSQQIADKLRAVRSVEQAWSRGSSLATSLYNVVQYLFFQEQDALKHELKSLRTTVEQQLNDFNRMRGSTPQGIAAFVLVQTENVILELARSRTSAELLVDPVLRAYSERLLDYRRMDEQGEYIALVNAHLAFLQAAHRRINEEIESASTTVEQKLGALRSRLDAEREARFESERRQLMYTTLRNTADIKAARAARSEATNAIASEARYESTLLINATTNAVEQVLNVKTTLSVPPEVLEQQLGDAPVPPLVPIDDTDAGVTYDENREQTLVLPPPISEPGTWERARIDDVDLWVRGFRGTLPPWDVVEFFESERVPVEEKVRRIAQLYSYADSVGTLYRGGGEPVMQPRDRQPIGAQNVDEPLNVPFLSHLEDAYQRLSVDSGEQYVSPFVLLGRLQALQPYIGESLLFVTDLSVGGQLAVLPNAERNGEEYRATLRLIAAFIDQAAQQRLANAYQLGPVLTSMRLADRVADDISLALRSGDIDADDNTLQRTEEMLRSQTSSLIELYRGLLNAVPTPVQGTQRALRDGLYRSARGQDESILLYQECDGGLFDAELSGARVRVSFYQPPRDDPQAEREINEALDTMASVTAPYKVHFNVQDTPIGDALEYEAQPLLVQTRQRVPWSQTSRVQMIDLQARSTILITVLSAAGVTLVEELARVRQSDPIDVTLDQLPESPFQPRFSALAGVDLRQQSLPDEEAQLFVDNMREYMTTERMPEALLEARAADDAAREMAATAERLRAQQQGFVARYLDFLARARRGEIEPNLTYELFNDVWASSNTNKLTMLFLALKAVTKMLYMVSWALGTWRFTNSLLTSLTQRVASAANTLAARCAQVTVASAVRYIATWLPVNEVANAEVWTKLAELTRAVGFGALGAVYDDFVVEGLLMVGRLIARAFAGTGSMIIYGVNMLVRLVKNFFEILASLVSLCAVSTATARGVLQFVERAHLAIDVFSILLAGVTAVGLYQSGLHYFAAELTHQLVSGFIQLNMFRALRTGIEYGLSATPLPGKVSVPLAHIITFVGMSSMTLAPWLTGAAYPVYGYLAPLVSGGLIEPTAVDDVYLTAAAATAAPAARFLAAAAGRSLGVALNDVVFQRRFTDERALPLEGMFRGAARLTRDAVYAFFARGAAIIDTQLELLERDRALRLPARAVDIVQPTLIPRPGEALSPRTASVALGGTTGMGVTDILMRQLEQHQRQQPPTRSPPSPTLRRPTPIQPSPAPRMRRFDDDDTLSSSSSSTTSSESESARRRRARRLPPPLDAGPGPVVEQFIKHVAALISLFYSVKEGVLAANTFARARVQGTAAGPLMVLVSSNAKNYLINDADLERRVWALTAERGLQQWTMEIFLYAFMQHMRTSGAISPERLLKAMTAGTRLQDETSFQVLNETIAAFFASAGIKLSRD